MDNPQEKQSKPEFRTDSGYTVYDILADVLYRMTPEQREKLKEELRRKVQESKDAEEKTAPRDMD